MDYRKIIKEIGRGKNHARDLDQDTARSLYSQMLEGDVTGNGCDFALYAH